LEGANQYYIYVSTRACYDPVKTIFIFAPGEEAKDLASAQRFAHRSGWQALAEYDAAVLLLPLAPKGWAAEQISLPGAIYNKVRNMVESRNGKSLMGREGKLWCWETLIYLVGYEDGAVFAGNCVVAEPSRFAATALIGGAPNDYSAGTLPSSHWLVRNVSSDYAVRNDQIPSSLWLLGVPEADARQAVEYFAAAGGFEQTPKQDVMGELQVCCYQNGTNPAQRLMLSERPALSGLSLAHIIMEEYFEHTIRWKNGPDGTLRRRLGRAGFYTNPRFLHSAVTVDCLEYAYSVHLPDGLSSGEVTGLPILFSVHGRGEPAWLFAEKNGWDVLADETQAFALVCPDSPGNIWQLKRDGHAFAAMINKLCADYGLDRTRVYLTGFSNGGTITREVGSAYPQLFAAIAPYNAPVHVPELVMSDVISSRLLPSGYELPYWVYVGDNDPAAGVDVDEQLEIMLAVNRCARRPAQGLTTCFAPDEVRTGKNYYTTARGYAEGDRFRTLVYHDSDGIPRVGYTVMKNMPHGAIYEQSQAAWEFLRHFRRPTGSKQVEYLPGTDERRKQQC